jgi:aldehyde dehydrogenase (NAD+)
VLRGHAHMAFWQDSNLLLIDGGLVPAGGGRTFPSIDPATEAVVGESADATAADAERAIRAARRAFDETDWSTDPKRRAGCLRHLAAAMRDVLEELRELTVREVGVPISMTSGPALEGPIGLLDFYADLAESYDGTVDLGPYEAYGGLHQRTVLREPYGVVSAISAYNYPTQLNLAKLGPALAAGCTVVLKGAPDTPLITLALGRLIAERTDIPPGVVNVLASSAVEPGVVMTTDPDVDMVTFTGSTAVGRSIMAAASETLKKTFLELGGKSALVVAVAKRIRTGTVSVNGGMWHAPDAPVGGYKQSGIGRENGTAGLEEFRQTKLLARPARG